MAQLVNQHTKMSKDEVTKKSKYELLQTTVDCEGPGRGGPPGDWVEAGKVDQATDRILDLDKPEGKG